MELVISTPTQDIVKRTRHEYSVLEQEVMKIRKQNVIGEIKILVLTGKTVIHENQELIASKVVTAFKDRKIINVMVISQTQSGKTGSMVATIKQYLEDRSNIIPIENIYIITGLSSCEWKEQTKSRMPESIQKRVYHRSDLSSIFVDEIKDKHNILIIMDEIQIAAKKGQTIYKTFQNAGLFSKSALYRNDIKILEYTATPDGTIYDLMKWNDASYKILADVGEGYMSAYQLLQEGRVKQYKNLCGYSADKGDNSVFTNIAEIKDDIERYEKPRYHIIRTKNGIEQENTIRNFKKVFTGNSYDYIKYDGNSDANDVNTTLAIAPSKHVFIFIKEMLRCAKTLVKTHIGILYERCSKNTFDSTIIQGLVGRSTGYDNNGTSICYTNINSIEMYQQLWESGFEDKSVKWNSSTTQFKQGELCAKRTFNDAENFDDASTISCDVVTGYYEPTIKKFATFDEMKCYFTKDIKGTLEGRGPNRPTPNADGFFESTIRSKKNVYEVGEIYAERRNGLSGSNYRCFPCYENKLDSTTIQWWLIHY